MQNSLLKDLNRNQQDAAEQIHGPVLILAGAGSGKTRVLTYRVAHLVAEKNISPDRILMMTFTNKAAGEMKDRIRTLLQKSGISGGRMPYAGTFHSFCARVLRVHGKHIGIPDNFVIFDEQDQVDTIRDILKKLDISDKNFRPTGILHTISEAKNELIGPTEYPQYARGHYQETVSHVYLEYQKSLKEQDALDFDDLLRQTVMLFEKNPDIAGIYQNTYEYIHIDEYQDTNKAQYQLAKKLAARHRNICVVGDASQSIYRWRGADFRNIINFKTDYPDTKEFHLERNYRSTQLILNAAFGVISKNTTHPILKLWTEKKNGEKITLYEARNEHDEASYLAQTILQSGRPFEDHAVLYRTNAQSRTIEESFLRAGIPYILVGGTRFYERKEVKDVLAYLRMIANPKDMVSYRRAEKVGKKKLAQFLAFADGVSKDAKLIGYTTLELLDRTLEATHYLELYDANVEEEAYRLENIKELRSVATEFPNIHEFLENVALVEAEYTPKRLQQRDEKRSAVTLMTLHAAKGLEFAIIYIVGMEEGLFPHSRTLMDREELEEERRLCYVGITRAKEKLYLTYANRRLFFGTRTQNMISRFIADIPSDIIDYQVSLDSGRSWSQDDMLL
jgi:DNA helicase-2/ATP-dependent DNA helicase PcrA